MSHTNNNLYEQGRQEYLESIMFPEELKAFNTLYSDNWEESDIPTYIQERAARKKEGQSAAMMEFFTPPKLAW